MTKAALLLAAALFVQAQSAPWKPADLVQPAAVAAALKNPGPKPVILFVGFPVMYRSTRIPGALLAGPGERPSGIDALKKAVAMIPKDKEIVVYCGCCPFPVCPNVRPAFMALRQMGYTKVKVMEIRENLSTDWVSKGYPTEKSAGISGF